MLSCQGGGALGVPGFGQQCLTLGLQLVLPELASDARCLLGQRRRRGAAPLGQGQPRLRQGQSTLDVIGLRPHHLDLPGGQSRRRPSQLSHSDEHLRKLDVDLRLVPKTAVLLQLAPRREQVIPRALRGAPGGGDLGHDRLGGPVDHAEPPLLGHSLAPLGRALSTIE